MIESFVRPESWITEVLRINSHIGGINELEFGYSQLDEMLTSRCKKSLKLKKAKKLQHEWWRGYPKFSAGEIRLVE
ncbi:MAG: hypothetical protein U9O96_03255 [Candidatus Thermoplasmatota archaeon]|nr:hypothetical protein [Candidatus Thermoplasmatota archaeon]